jgi:hypothetical protein
VVTLLTFSDGQPFATGAAGYDYLPATETESSVRLILQIELEGVSAAAIVVCAPKVARQLNLVPSASLGRIRLLIRGVSIMGHLYRLNVTFLARQGNDLTIDATVFGPDPEWEESWGDLPSFIGLGGCLERMRFAVDPGSDTFYFGTVA